MKRYCVIVALLMLSFVLSSGAAFAQAPASTTATVVVEGQPVAGLIEWTHTGVNTTKYVFIFDNYRWDMGFPPPYGVPAIVAGVDNAFRLALPPDILARMTVGNHTYYVAALNPYGEVLSDPQYLVVQAPNTPPPAPPTNTPPTDKPKSVTVTVTVTTVVK